MVSWRKTTPRNMLGHQTSHVVKHGNSANATKTTSSMVSEAKMEDIRHKSWMSNVSLLTAMEHMSMGGCCQCRWSLYRMREYYIFFERKA